MSHVIAAINVHRATRPTMFSSLTPNGQASRAGRPDGPDRRSRRRYPLVVELRFAVTGPGVMMALESGVSCNLSSSGLLFESHRVLPVGAIVTAALRWPASPAGMPGVFLMVSGKVAWSGEGKAALALSTYRFVAQDGYPTLPVFTPRGMSTRGLERRSNSPEGPVVLVVESSDVYAILEGMLSRYGFVVWHARAEEAAEVLRGRRGLVQVLVTNQLERFSTFIGQIPIIQTVDRDHPPSPEPPAGVTILTKPLLYRPVLSAILSTASAQIVT